MDSPPTLPFVSTAPDPTFPPATQNDFNNSLSRLDDATSTTLMRYFQDLEQAEVPVSPIVPKYHTGKLPNSKAADGKPRLLLMGQRR